MPSACSSVSRRSWACTRSSAWSSRSRFNLNRVAVLLGVYSNLPWILPAYYTLATMLGGDDPSSCDVPPGLLKDFREALDRRLVGRVPQLRQDADPARMGVCPRIADWRRGHRRRRLSGLAYNDRRSSSASQFATPVNKILSSKHLAYIHLLCICFDRIGTGAIVVVPAAAARRSHTRHDVALALARAQDRRNRHRGCRVCLPVRSHRPGLALRRAPVGASGGYRHAGDLAPGCDLPPPPTAAERRRRRVSTFETGSRRPIRTCCRWARSSRSIGSANAITASTPSWTRGLRSRAGTSTSTCGTATRHGTSSGPVRGPDRPAARMEPARQHAQPRRPPVSASRGRATGS